MRSKNLCGRLGDRPLLKKMIFSYWHQGFDNAPDIIKACVERFQKLCPDWQVVLLDSESVLEFVDLPPIPQGKWRRLELAHRSDLLRTGLLIKYGGVWADPTVWLYKPLDTWLPNVLSAGLFMFYRPGRDRVVSNWFIAAEKENRLLHRQYERLCAYWSENEFDNLDGEISLTGRLVGRILNRNLHLPRLWLRKPMIRLFRTYPYMVYHYMIFDLICSDAELRAIWDRMPKVSADIPHFPAHQGLFTPLDEETKRFIDGGEAPLFKLTWKLPGPVVPDGSILDYLLSGQPA